MRLYKHSQMESMLFSQNKQAKNDDVLSDICVPKIQTFTNILF